MYLLPLVGMKDLSLKKSPINDGTRRKIIRQMKTTTNKNKPKFLSTKKQSSMKEEREVGISPKR